MPVRLVAEKNGSFQFSGEIPDHLKSFLIRGAESQAASGPFGYLLLQQLNMQQFRIQYNRYCFLHNERINFLGSEPMLELLFNLGAPLNYRLQELGNLSFLKCGYNIIYLPAIDNAIECQQDSIYHTFSVHLPVDYLVFIASYFPRVNELLQTISNNQPGLLYPDSPVAPVDVLNIIHDIIMVKYSGELLQVYVMARITELLILCFEHGSLPPASDRIHLWKADLAAIEAIRREILENLHQSFNLPELALKAGMNKDKLVRGFRLVVGTPLFDFLLEARMRKARFLLLTTEHSVSEIGYEVGYHYVHSFSKAFKKYYGLSPLRYRRKYDKDSLS